jgi:hypothetical protein
MTKVRVPVQAVPLIAACVLAAGCVGAHLVANVDPEAERRSTVYEIEQPGGFWLEKRLNVSFGPYRVADADLGRTRTERGRDTEKRRYFNWLSLLFKNEGLIVTESSREDTKKQRLAYRFEIAGKAPWTATCTLRRLVRHREESHMFTGDDGGPWDDDDHRDSTDVLTSTSMTCVYSRPGEGDWVLSMETDAVEQTGRALLTNQEEAYAARRVTSTLVVGDDGRKANSWLAVPTGYEWVRGEGILGTLVTYREGRRLLLDRDCPAATADVLAMGSSGLVLHGLTTDQD